MLFSFLFNYTSPFDYGASDIIASMNTTLTSKETSPMDCMRPWSSESARVAEPHR